jgi:hypothetical protein
MLPAQERCKGIRGLIDQEQYFVIHAARQSGKTTLLLDLAKELNDSEEYYALYCTLESVQGIGDAETGIPAVVRTLAGFVLLHPLLKAFQFAGDADFSDFNNVLKLSLSFFCAELDRPLVILFDETDCLSDATLISFLRQLRSGYAVRYQIPFVHSVRLIGMRNIRDYRAKVREDRESLGSASPFNIVRKTMTLRNFTKQELADLYSQHTEQTGQVFSSELIEKIWHYTQGQPWLANAVAAEIAEEILGNFSETPLPEHADQAVQNIIFRRDAHIDSLLERLKEKRVQRIIEPVILGESIGYDLLDDDYRYALDIGLVKESEEKLVPANPVYAEVIIRGLSSQAQMEMAHRNYPPRASAYRLPDGRLDMKRLLSDFQEFWRENSEIWTERYQYKEVAPHLVLAAFLQRVINQGGKIAREFASGRGRLDLCIHYGGHRYPVELKLRYKQKTYEEGKKQIAKYMDVLGCGEGWLVVFDRRKSISWKKKVFWKTSKSEKGTIHTVGC